MQVVCARGSHESANVTFLLLELSIAIVIRAM